MILFGYPVLVYDKVLGNEERDRIHKECMEQEKTKTKTSATWECDVYTTCWDSDMHEDPKFKEPLCIFTDKVKHFLTVHGVDEDPLLQMAWFNSYTKEQFQDQHIHSGTHVSAVYFLSAPEGSAPLKFHHPSPPNVPIAFNFENDYLKEQRYINSVDDRLIVFLSHTPHSVPQGYNEESRYSIAINYGVTNRNNYKATQLTS